MSPPHLPRGIFFRWTNPGPGRDLLVFLGEAQPATGSYAYANELLDMAQTLGVERVVTFASMASGLHPSEDPKVTGAATDEGTLGELRRVEVQPMQDGQIGGLNGVLLGAAAHRGIPGMSLLAEIPFFAAAVPNPKAAKAALSVFTVLAEVDISLQELSRHASAMDRLLIEAMKKIQEQEDGEGEEPDIPGLEVESDPDEIGEAPPPSSEPSSSAASSQTPSSGAATPTPPERKLDYQTRRHVEQLFHEARSDRAKAVRLKEELDRLGIYPQYEDRFLDLFRRAE